MFNTFTRKMLGSEGVGEPFDETSTLYTRFCFHLRSSIKKFDFLSFIFAILYLVWGFFYIIWNVILTLGALLLVGLIMLPTLFIKPSIPRRPDYVETTEDCLLLSSEDKQFLLNIIRNESSKDLKDRARILIQINEGRPISTIAHDLFISKEEIIEYLARYEENPLDLIPDLKNPKSFLWWKFNTKPWIQIPNFYLKTQLSQTEDSELADIIRIGTLAEKGYIQSRICHSFFLDDKTYKKYLKKYEKMKAS